MSERADFTKPNDDTAEPHVIRLRGPWKYTIAAETKGVDPGRSNSPAFQGTLKAPVDLVTALSEPPPTRVTLQRRFGCPSNLDPSERVDLVIERLDLPGEVFLNQSRLGTLSETKEPTRFPIRNRLKPRNELMIAVTFTSEAVQAIGQPQTLDVRLELVS